MYKKQAIRLAKSLNPLRMKITPRYIDVHLKDGAMLTINYGYGKPAPIVR